MLHKKATEQINIFAQQHQAKYTSRNSRSKLAFIKYKTGYSKFNRSSTDFVMAIFLFNYTLYRYTHFYVSMFQLNFLFI